MQCNFCEYIWKERTDSPKECPRCKRRFDYEELKQINFPIKESEVDNKWS